MKKIFIAAPFTHNFENDFIKQIEKLLTELGYYVAVPHNFANSESRDEELLQEIKKDFSMLDSCDIVLADVSKPSHGVGMEILHAHRNGKTVILAMQAGTKLSGMARVHAHHVIEYDNFDDLKGKLEIALKTGL